MRPMIHDNLTPVCEILLFCHIKYGKVKKVRCNLSDKVTNRFEMDIARRDSSMI